MMSWRLIDQVLDVVSRSLIEAVIVSPGEMLIVLMETGVAGSNSNHAE